MSLPKYNLNLSKDEITELMEFLGDESRWNYLTYDDINIPQNGPVQIMCNQVGLSCTGEYSDHYILSLIKKLGTIVWEKHRENLKEYNNERRGTPNFKERPDPGDFKTPPTFHFRAQWGKFNRMSTTKVDQAPLQIHSRYLIHFGSDDSYLLTNGNKRVVIDMSDGDFIVLSTKLAKNHDICTEKGKFRTTREGKRKMKRPDHIRRTLILDIDLPLNTKGNSDSDDSDDSVSNLNINNLGIDTFEDEPDNQLSKEEIERIRMEQFMEESIQKISRESKMSRQELLDIIRQAQATSSDSQ